MRQRCTPWALHGYNDDDDGEDAHEENGANDDAYALHHSDFVALPKLFANGGNLAPPGDSRHRPSFASLNPKALNLKPVLMEPKHWSLLCP